MPYAFAPYRRDKLPIYTNPWEGPFTGGSTIVDSFMQLSNFVVGCIKIFYYIKLDSRICFPQFTKKYLKYFTMRIITIWLVIARSA